MENKKNLVLFILLALVVALIVFFVFAEKNEPAIVLIEDQDELISSTENDEYWSQAITKIKKIDSDKEVYFTDSCDISNLSSPSGEIFLSLMSKENDRMGIYILDVATGAINEFLVDDVNDLYGINFSSDDSMASFVSMGDNGSDVFVVSANKENIQQITKKSSDHITSPQLYSNNTKVLFSAVEYPVADFPDSRKIYSSDLNGNDVFLTDGSNPILSPDEKKILVTKVAGIYLFDIETMEQERVIELRDSQGDIIFNTFFTKARLSQDGTKLAVSDASDERSELYLFEINSWEPFDYKLKAIVNNPSFWWKAFSTDSNYVVAQVGEIVVSESDGDEEEVYFESKNTRLAIFDTCNFNEIKSFDFGEKFDLVDMFVDEWR